MDIATILRELDAEIEKLKRVRKIIAGLEQPLRSRKKKPRRKPIASSVTDPAAEPLLVPVTAVEPLLIKLPPKLKREHRPRIKPFVRAPIALATAPSDKPVFVPRVALSSADVEQSPKSTDYNPEMLEATFRKNFLSAAVSGSTVAFEKKDF